LLFRLHFRFQVCRLSDLIFFDHLAIIFGLSLSRRGDSA
jgi:hypothetical protein